ncbi:hypothetical protein OSTOST_24747 [Ostertagia ostertagi]
MHVGADGGEDSREPREAPEDAREENGDKGSTAGEVDEESADSCSEVNANEAEVDNVSEWSPDHSSEESDSSSTSSSSVPKHTYTLYCMMSTMHMNTLRLAEDTGERDVVRIYQVQRKFLARKSTQVLKTPAEHTWRKYIFQDVLRRRLLKWNGGRHDGDDDDVERELYVS